MNDSFKEHIAHLENKGMIYLILITILGISFIAALVRIAILYTDGKLYEIYIFSTVIMVIAILAYIFVDLYKVNNTIITLYYNFKNTKQIEKKDFYYQLLFAYTIIHSGVTANLLRIHFGYIYGITKDKE